MSEHPEKPIATFADDAGLPDAETDEHRFGDSTKQQTKQEIAEDQAAEDLGNFA
jgi:hypothetical protein